MRYSFASHSKQGHVTVVASDEASARRAAMVEFWGPDPLPRADRMGAEWDPAPNYNGLGLIFVGCRE